MPPTQAFHRRAARRVLPLLVAVTAASTAAPASAQSLSVKLWSDRGDGAVYQSGDPINLGVRTNRDANLIVYEIDAQGSVHVLFPWQGGDTGIEGGATLDLPQDPAEQLVVEGPVGEGYIVAIASDEPFRGLPWYLRPRDARAEEMGYTADDRVEDGVTPDGRIVGDPFVAMERIRRQVLADPSDTHSFATTYTSYYVHHAVQYPRYLCNDCHRPGYWAWWDGFDPYYAQCSAFEFRVNANWWWGPTYWTTYVPYYAYVFRTSCPPRFRPRGAVAWYSSWDGWRRWNGNWGGPLRRYKTAPPAGYVGPSRWERSRNERGANRPLPPGFLASAHERPPGMGLPNSGIRRERREGWTPASGSSNNGSMRDNGSRGAGRPAPGERRWDTGRAGAGRETPGPRRWDSGRTPPPDPGPGRYGRGERGGSYQPRPERGSGAQQPNPGGGRDERQQHERSRWGAPRAEPAPAPTRGESRGEQRRERTRQPDPPKQPDSTPSVTPDPSGPHNDDGWKPRHDRGKRG